ncbi:MAG TPA: SpoIIE family protein phosphatase, partial [Spirochaetia bacterium]|nr:SpoIIE family protein phosphatase [Spirochaetia bacterium]
GGYILFANRNVQGTLSILYSVSNDGQNWPDFKVLEQDPGLSLNFNPEFVSFDGRQYVAFQSADPSVGGNYQVYLKYSDDGGLTWSQANRLSNFMDPGDNRATYNIDSYDNQRPYLAVTGEGLAIAWERRRGRESNQIDFALLTKSGTIAGDAIPATRGPQTANYPIIVADGDQTSLVWFDNRYGNDRIMFATKEGVFFRQREVGTVPGDSTFPSPVVLKGRIYLFWQNRRSATDINLVYQPPDTQVNPAAPLPVNFVAGRRSAATDVRIRWTAPQDPSGIAGYSYVWTQDPNASVPETVLSGPDKNSVDLRAGADGPWYFRMRTTDFAGNWSTVATLQFFRDTTPPGVVAFLPPALDESGFLVSNSFTVKWQPPPDPDVAGYTYSLDYLGGPLARPVPVDYQIPNPPARLLTATPELSETNFDNGLWSLTVSAIDSVGNIGKPSTVLLRLNKYVPVTYISFVDTKKDSLGRVTMDIIGRGFDANGVIDEVILDRDGKEPWDYTFSLKNGSYTITSDRNISGPVIDLINQGTYRVGLIHSERGLYMTQPLLTFESSGTIKFGDFTVHYSPQYVFAPPRFFSVPVSELLLWTTLIFLALVILFSSTRIVALAREGRMLRDEVHVLLVGRRALGPPEAERIQMMRKKGFGIRIKFSFFVVVLVIAVVLMVAVILGRFMLDTQRSTLADGLKNRVEVLLQSIATGAGQYLPNADQNVLALSGLTEQMSAVQEAQYVTITGPGGAAAAASNGNDYIWATNDPRITDPKSVQSMGQLKLVPEQFQRGRTRIEDGVTPLVSSLEQKINTESRQALGDIPKQLADLSRRILQLVQQTGPQAEAERTSVDNTRSELERRANQQLNKIGSLIGSVPDFNPNSLNRSQTIFEFYKPIVYLQPNSDIYYHGLVRIAVSTDRILTQIQDATNNLIRNTVIIAMIAVGIGIVGALLLATVIVIPIRRLVRGIEIIRDTEDKSELAGHVINVGTRDEISTLADVINQMTTGLVHAAEAAKMLTVGKEVQKMFIPLDKNNEGSKGTTGRTDTAGAEFFGYYEGAKGVSGDYFDYERIDDEHYAIIKCDVAGKGVPAALIMVEVATIFLNHFRNWSAKSINSTLPELVGTINDLLEERGFKGRFAALMVVIMNIKTGACSICHAGDNIVHVYDATAAKMMKSVLPEQPAAGVFATMLVKGGFVQVPLKLKTGDILLLYTDGLEEAKRIVRNSEFDPVIVTQEQIDRKEYEATMLGQPAEEEIGPDRIEAIAEAIQNRGIFRLQKKNNPLEDEELVFDFASVDPTVENTVMGLIAVEKIFRIYPDPRSSADDRIVVDSKINQFLRKCFKQYDRYFSQPLEKDPDTAEYLTFARLREDEQYDDLTIVGIRKK